MNSKRVNAGRIMAIRNNDGELIEESKEIATILNNQFKSVFTNDNGILPYVNIVNNTNNNLGSTNITVNKNKIIDKLSKLDVNKSCGVIVLGQ